MSVTARHEAAVRKCLADMYVDDCTAAVEKLGVTNIGAWGAEIARIGASMDAALEGLNLATWTSAAKLARLRGNEIRELRAEIERLRNPA